MMHPGRENWLGSVGSANTYPSLETFLNISANMCCAIVARSCCGATRTVRYCHAGIVPPDGAVEVPTRVQDPVQRPKPLQHHPGIRRASNGLCATQNAVRSTESGETVEISRPWRTRAVEDSCDAAPDALQVKGCALRITCYPTGTRPAPASSTRRGRSDKWIVRPA